MQAPTGFWDPAGFTADGSVENFKRRRQTELKHGRISMLATMGYITPEQLGKTVFFPQLCQTLVIKKVSASTKKLHAQHDIDGERTFVRSKTVFFQSSVKHWSLKKSARVQKNYTHSMILMVYCAIPCEAVMKLYYAVSRLGNHVHQCSLLLAYTSILSTMSLQYFCEWLLSMFFSFGMS